MIFGEFHQNYLSLLLTVFITTQCKFTVEPANIQLLWINTTRQAFESGVDVVKIQREFCAKNKMPEVYYINYDNVEPLFGLEIAEDLIRNFSFVAINFENLCQELAILQRENMDLDWHLQNYQIQRQLQSQHYELQLQSREFHKDQLQHPTVPKLEKDIQTHLKNLNENANNDIYNGILQPNDKTPQIHNGLPQLPAQLDEQKGKDEESLGEEVKLEAESEAELKIQQKLGDELGKKIDVERPLKVSESDSKQKEGSERGPIGIDVSALDRLNIESLEKALRGENDTEINEIFKVFAKMRKNPERQKLFASTNIIPLMKRVKYDPRTAPTLLEDQTVTVRVGIHVQSLSNFQLTTMDYDMDLWLRMCWRDPRLAHGLNAPILITEESFLRRIWRPDAFFVNSVDSLFHRVTYLNFYMFVFPEGEVFFEARLYLKPKSLLVLCKYPHDSQIIYLRISSIAFTNNTVRFEWFTKRSEAIYINHNVQLRELYITGVEKTVCNSRRKTGKILLCTKL